MPTPSQFVAFIVFVLLLLGWAAGLLLDVGGQFIHLLLIAAVLLLIASIAAGRRSAREHDAESRFSRQ
jgi:uncharacterized protein DUF5670